MAYVPTNVVIDEKTFTFHHLSIRKLNKILIRTAKLCGESIAKLVNDGVETAFLSKEKKDLSEEEKKKQFADLISKIDVKEIVTSLLNSLDEEEVDKLLIEIFSGTTVEGLGQVSLNFDECFGNSIKTLYKAAYSAYKFYYKDFF